MTNEDAVRIRAFRSSDRDQVQALAPGARRRGIATRLMGAAEAWAADLGLGFLTLETGAANQEARSLYAALGYLEEDVRLAKAVPGSADPD